MVTEGPVHLRRHDLNLLVVYAVLMEELNVTRTAMRLNMSQAAVSASLQRLRKMFDDQLFVRATGGMAPTAKARQIHSAISAGLVNLHEAIDGAPSFDPSSERAVFRLGMSDDLESVFMPKIIQTLTAMSPSSSAHCIQTRRAGVEELVTSGHIDIGIAASSAWGSEIRSRDLFESSYACVYNPALIDRRGELSYTDYLALPHLMISADGTRGIVDDVLQAEGQTRHITASTGHFAMVPFLLSRVPAVATMPEFAARVFAESFELTVSRPPIQLPRFTVNTLWHQSQDNSPALQWMVRVIDGIATELKDDQWYV
ncbi:LysR family transcriptional regulator [Mycobacterium sp. smrl_JER01]|uniref:LysR family transcriptional regulator n=1 Tax=Mycobacterium sp. smrl_JER01 TaxID=3402633 RepID=UPI003AD7E2F4